MWMKVKLKILRRISLIYLGLRPYAPSKEEKEKKQNFGLKLYKN